MRGVIYKYTNLKNGKVYIGQTIHTLNRRRISHESKALSPTTHFHRAIKLYGKDKFIWEELCCCASKKDLNEKESYYIELFNSVNTGYNMTAGGEGTIGRSCKDSTKLKISLSKTGTRLSEEQKAKLSNMRSGVPKSSNHVEKVAEAISKEWEITFPFGNVVVIKNLSKFCRDHNISDRGMWLVANGYRKQHKGFKCRKLH